MRLVTTPTIAVPAGNSFQILDPTANGNDNMQTTTEAQRNGEEVGGGNMEATTAHQRVIEENSVHDGGGEPPPAL